ncbi:nicotinamide mononucleotide transporter [Kineococcus xinjiangensis]|uniref:Nicotinamide mononucleotide transporter n=1 Tax=Kineococcus xinjiangensis TaxID=512762 RepID=A0A2S6IPF6_9ACTN|nr:nicotinamide riboside transporter PnuC [Kineococcus xinjiangensis]PPK96055.1 nicotinamide mononucleotide transporter [Kineococcus xinjiangensis]
MNLLDWLLTGVVPIGAGAISVREVVGNGFGLASAIGGMRRRVWAWPVGIVGNLLLLTVFLGGVFTTPQGTTLLGQAGRQVLFVAVSVYGWVRWRESRRSGGGADGAVVPRWATWRERAGLLVVAVGLTALLTPIFEALGSWPPVWADAWTFTGSLLATYGMARGWVDFWLVWIAVDVVGVPLLLQGGFYPSAVMYGFYGVFCLVGFAVWWRTQRRLALQTSPRPTSALPAATDPSMETLG